MEHRIRGNEYRTTIVCVDSYDNDVLAGRFYNPSLSEGETFQSLTQFLVKMNQALDVINLPQAFSAARAFAPPSRGKTGSSPQTEAQEGALATFAVRVIFRQNASWQGSVTWLEEGREQSFRSALELILLINSALDGTEGNSGGGRPLLRHAQA